MTSKTLPSRLQNSTKLLVFVDCLQTDDFELLDSRRSLYLHFIADVPSEQRLTDGRGRRDQALRRVRLLGSHQLVFDFDGLLDIQDPDARAVTGAIGRDIRQIEHSNVAQPLFQLAQTRGNIALAFLGVL